MQLTEQIQKTLFEEILNGKYSPGERFPTEFETAERFKVSRITVRRAYGILENAGIILRKPRRGTIVNSSYSASTEPITTIAAIMPITVDFSRVFLETLCAEAAKENILIVIEPHAGSGKALSDTAVRLASNGIKNMIIWPDDDLYDSELFCRLRVLGVNLVFFDRIFPADGFADYVGLDNAHSVDLLVKKSLGSDIQHLIYCGAGDLAFFTNRERRQAFISCCKKNNLAYSFFEFDHQKYSDSQLQESLRRLLLDGSGKKALLCVNDQIALEAFPAVPRIYPIYSIDGTAEAYRNGIISVAQPMQEMAKKCLDALKKQRKLGSKWSAQEYRLKGDIFSC